MMKVNATAFRHLIFTAATAAQWIPSVLKIHPVLVVDAAKLEIGTIDTANYNDSGRRKRNSKGFGRDHGTHNSIDTKNAEERPRITLTNAYEPETPKKIRRQKNIVLDLGVLGDPSSDNRILKSSKKKSEKSEEGDDEPTRKTGKRSKRPKKTTSAPVSAPPTANIITQTPSLRPTTRQPTNAPTNAPSHDPSEEPTWSPSTTPSSDPTAFLGGLVRASKKDPWVPGETFFKETKFKATVSGESMDAVDCKTCNGLQFRDWAEVNCRNKKSCQDATFYHHDAKDTTVRCTKESCVGTKFVGNDTSSNGETTARGSTDSPSFRVFCDDNLACENAVFENLSYVGCTGDGEFPMSCFRAQFLSVEDVNCGPDSVCEKARFENVSRVECNGKYACSSSTFDNCRTIQCNQEGSCYKSFINEATELRCSGYTSCAYVYGTNILDTYCDQASSCLNIDLNYVGKVICSPQRGLPSCAAMYVSNAEEVYCDDYNFSFLPPSTGTCGDSILGDDGPIRSLTCKKAGCVAIETVNVQDIVCNGRYSCLGSYLLGVGKSVLCDGRLACSSNKYFYGGKYFRISPYDDSQGISVDCIRNNDKDVSCGVAKYENSYIPFLGPITAIDVGSTGTLRCSGDDLACEYINLQPGCSNFIGLAENANFVVEFSEDSGSITEVCVPGRT